MNVVYRVNEGCSRQNGVKTKNLRLLGKFFVSFVHKVRCRLLNVSGSREILLLADFRASWDYGDWSLAVHMNPDPIAPALSDIARRRTSDIVTLNLPPHGASARHIVTHEDGRDRQRMDFGSDCFLQPPGKRLNRLFAA
jgi:hypothetical protein